jgi:hypothetical protein
VHALSDLLYVTACLAFVVVMIASVLLYDRTVGSRIYEAPDAPGRPTVEMNTSPDRPDRPRP